MIRTVTESELSCSVPLKLFDINPDLSWYQFNRISFSINSFIIASRSVALCIFPAIHRPESQQPIPSVQFLMGGSSWIHANINAIHPVIE